MTVPQISPVLAWIVAGLFLVSSGMNLYSSKLSLESWQNAKDSRTHWTDLYNASEARLETITNAAARADDKEVAAIDAMRDKAQSKKVSGKDARGREGSIEGVFGGGTPVLIETNFGAGNDAVKTRYYLDSEMKPVLVARTFIQNDRLEGKPYNEIYRWYFAGGEYLTFRFDWEPGSAKTSEVLYAPDSVADIAALKAEIATYLQALGVKVAVSDWPSLPPDENVASIDRTVAAIDANSHLTTVSVAKAESPRYGAVKLEGFYDGKKLLKIALQRVPSSIPTQDYVSYDALGRMTSGPRPETYYFDKDGHLVLARTWNTTRTDSYATRESTVPSTSYVARQLDVYFYNDKLLTRMLGGKPYTNTMGEIDQSQGDALYQEIEDYVKVFPSRP